MEQKKTTYTVLEATKKLEYYCAYQERCHLEVAQKLKEMGMIPLAAEQIIVHLIEQEFLNETRYALAFARGKHRIKGWGKNRIQQELNMRHISTYNIQLALKSLDQEHYSENWKSQAEKKWNSLTDSTIWKKKKKFTDYFLRKGYEFGEIMAMLQELTLPD